MAIIIIPAIIQPNPKYRNPLALEEVLIHSFGMIPLMIAVATQAVLNIA